MELLNLVHEALIDLSALAGQILDAFLDLVRDPLNLIESMLDLLVDLLVHFVLWVLVHELDPLDETGVLGDDLSSRLASELLKVSLVLHELVRLFRMLVEVFLHLLDFLRDIACLLQVDIVHVLNNVIDQLLTLVDQSVIEVMALDEEHAHSDFIGGLSLDLIDSVLVLLNAIDILLLVSLLLLTERFDLLRLLHQEEILIVHIDSLLSDLQIVEKNLCNFLLGVHDNLVVRADLPEVRLVGIGDLSVSTRDVVDCLDHGHDYLHQLVLDLR